MMTTRTATRDFNLLNESNTEYDGSSWDKAIIGNAMCDNTKDRTGNEFLCKQSTIRLLSTTIDNTEYSQANGKYRSETDSYGDFWTNSGNQNKQYLSGWGTYNKIANNRDGALHQRSAICCGKSSRVE